MRVVYPANNQIDMVLHNSNMDIQYAFWSTYVSSHFWHRWGVDDEYSKHWEERLEVSTPTASLEINYYSYKQDKHNKERKKEVKYSLSELWHNSEVKDPRTEIIPEYEQLLKLLKIVQECFWRIKQAEISQKEENSEEESGTNRTEKKPEVLLGCTSDLVADMANLDVLEHQKIFTGLHSIQEDDQKEDSSECSSSSEDESSGSDDSNPPAKVAKLEHETDSE